MTISLDKFHVIKRGWQMFTFSIPVPSGPLVLTSTMRPSDGQAVDAAFAEVQRRSHLRFSIIHGIEMDIALRGTTRAQIAFW